MQRINKNKSWQLAPEIRHVKETTIQEELSEMKHKIAISDSYLKTHETRKNMSQFPKVQAGPYNPYYVVQMHQLQNNKSHEHLEAEPVQKFRRWELERYKWLMITR